MRTSRRSFLIGGALVAGSAVAGGAVEHANTSPAPTTNEQPAAYRRPATKTTMPFKSVTFNNEGLFVLGAAGCNVAEVGEVLTTFDAINAQTGNPANVAERDYDVYVSEFLATGDRLASLAEASAAAGQAVTAKYQYLRASNYATQALFFVLGTSQPDREEQLFDTVNARWQAALGVMSPTPVQFSVQAGAYTMPAYLFRPDDSGTARPTLIVCAGSDGQNVESMQFGVVTGLERGYNIALFEGPGQMSLLFKEQIPFTPDWDEVVGPVVEALAARPDVQSDRIGLVGTSFAGMLCARAAARTPGLRAVVLEPAAVDMTQIWADPKDVAAVKDAQNASAAVRDKTRKEVNAYFHEGWPHLSPTVQFVIHKRSEIFTTQAQDDARAGKPPSDYFGLIEALIRFNYADDYRAITIPTLVTANQGDTFFGQQPHQAFGLLTKVPAADKKLIVFTDAEGAEGHDQPMAPQFSQETIFGWLDPYLME